VLGVELLFDGREEAVEIDVEEGEAVGMDLLGQDAPIIFAFCLLHWFVLNNSLPQ